MADVHALLVETDCEIARPISRSFRSRGCRIDLVSDGESALSVARQGAYDVLILDWSLPGISGLEVFNTLRAESRRIPTLFLLAAGQDGELDSLPPAEKKHYLIKPIDCTELIHRVQQLARREADSTVRLSAGTIEVDLVARSAVRCGRPLKLSPHEFRLLEFFVRNADRLVTRQMLLTTVWHLDFDPHTSVVESHISRLRKRLNAHAQPDPIQTIRSIGYKLISTP